MSIERVNPAELARPSGFSHAVVGHGTLVLLAGQTALDAAGRITGADVVAQFEVALGNLLTALAAAGGRPDQLASLTVYVVDMDDYRRNSAALGQVWRRLAGRDYPAMAAVGVARLWDAAALVEVQGMAILERSGPPGRRAPAPAGRCAEVLTIVISPPYRDRMTMGGGARLSRSAHVDTFCRDNLPPRQLARADLRAARGALPGPAELRARTARRGDRPARRRPRCLLTPQGDVWSYADLLRTVNQIARVLTGELGIVPGNRVLLRGPNNPWLAACWLAVLKAGAVAVTTMPLLRAGELTTVAEIAQVDLALCDWRFEEDLRAADLRGAPIVSYGGPEASDLTQRAAAAPDGFAAVPTAADDVALLAFTSGTTGRPKATMHFHRDVLAIADTFSRHVVRPVAGDLFTGTPPLAFTFGLGGLLVFPLRAGAATLLIEKASPEDLADEIAKHQVTVCSTAPTGYRAMIAAGKAGQLGSLRRPISAGEHLPEATWRAFREATGVSLIDGIGSTEMLHVFVSAADDDIRPGATGQAVPGYRATILDEAGVPVPPARAGTAGRPGAHRLPVPQRPAPGQLRAGRLEHHRRHVHPGRGRLLLLPGAQRRHDRLLRLQHRRPGGRGSTAGPSGGLRVRGGRRARRGPGPAGQGVCCPRIRAAGGRRPDRPVAGVRQRKDCAVQISAGHRIRRCAAADGHRQSAAVRAARPAAGAAQVSGAMRIAVVGGGPGGLYFAALTKQLSPGHTVTVWERNAADDTFGFGVVFSDETLGGIEHADEAIYAQMEREFATWDDIDVHAGGTVHTSGGHGFAAMSRRRLLEILQQRCRALGVRLHFSTPAPDVAELSRTHDLVVAADGVNSTVRARYADTFRPTLDIRHCKYMWLGTDKVFDAFKFYIRETPYGVMQIHGYPYDAKASTFIVEMNESVWQRAGFAALAGGELAPGQSDERSAGLVRELFADILDGHDGAAEQLPVGQLRHGAQRALAARQRRAARRRRAHRALLHRLGYQAGHGGRARAGRLPARTG